MRNAKTANRQSDQPKPTKPWIPAALAAGLAVAIVGGFLLRQPGDVASQFDEGNDARSAVAANVTMTLEETKTVNLVFESAIPVGDVILTVDLPMGVELAAYPGRMQMRWATSLQAGKNNLPLELIAFDGMGGEIVATMQSDGTEKIFRIDVEVVDG